MGQIDMSLTAEEKIHRAIIQMQKSQPFFSYLAMYLEPREIPVSMKGKTLGSIGVNAQGKILYDSDWIKKQKDDELTGVIVHEVCHVALLHMTRRGNRDPVVSNVAQDVVVNMMVKQAGLHLPSDGIPVDTYGNKSEFTFMQTRIRIDNVSEKAWERVYDDIISQLLQNPNVKLVSVCSKDRKGLGFDDHIEGDGESGKGGGENEDGEGGFSDAELQEIEKQWTSRLAEAVQTAKQRGELPAGMQRMFDDLLKPKVMWKQMLMKYLRPFLSPVDWSYQRPHKKSQILEVYMPNVLKEHIEVEVIVDTSGSIGQAELSEFLSEIVGIAKSFSHMLMHVTFVDAAVHERYIVDNGDIPKILAMKSSGGGGTSMEVGIQYVKEHNPNVPIVCILTDGYDSYAKSRRDFPFDVIWVISKNGVDIDNWNNGPSYGQRVKMDG